MTEIHNKQFTDERSLFRSKGVKIEKCSFDVGESALKHSEDVDLHDCDFLWKYPVWYCNNVNIDSCRFSENTRAALWYTNNVRMTNTDYNGVKAFRRCDNVNISGTKFANGSELLWECSNVFVKDIYVSGDYLCMNSRDISVDGLVLDGCYSFDGVKNLHITNSKITGRDAFWNSENILAENCVISGAYLGWNSKNLTFINCEIESLQGMCYIENLKLINCTLKNTTLAFEYSTVDADIVGSIDSILDPTSGRIKADSIGEILIKEDNPTQIITNSPQ